ncbi:MAG: hypothetical protein JWO67_922 [Streptosporangiaceae bacterium]|nr:hypothetical protein [Streptosporangiaceae bacterium]
MTTTATTREAEAKILERIKKLLVKAAAEGCTKAEAEALTARAAEMMAKYGIARALLADKDPTSDKMVDFTFEVEGAYPKATSNLINGIAKAFRCKIIQIGEHPHVTLHIIGFESDCERVEVMFTSLDLQMINALMVDVPDGTPAIDRVSEGYCMVYAGAVVARLQDRERVERKEAGEASTGTELVLARREDQVGARFKQLYPHTRVVRSSYDRSASGKAYAAAQRADLGGARVGGRPKAAIG